MKISEIIKTPPIDRLWSGDPLKIEAIKDNILENDFDQAEPVIVWEREGECILIDGNTRLQAAKLAGKDTIPASTKHFETEDEALEYAIHRQRDRRNLSDADYFMCILELDKRKRAGGQQGNNNASKTTGASEPVESVNSSAKKTAALVGTSESKVKKARVIEDHADADTKEAVMTGKKSINKAYQETQHKRKPAKKKKTMPIIDSSAGTRPEENQKKETIRDASYYAMAAIRQLEKISIDDPGRGNAFNQVIEWINTAHDEALIAGTVQEINNKPVPLCRRKF